MDLDPMGPDLPSSRGGGRAGLKGLDVPDELADVLLPDPLLARDRGEKAFDIDLLFQTFERGQAVLFRLRQGSRINETVGELQDSPPLFREDVDRPRPGQDQTGMDRVLAHGGEDVVPDLVPVDVPDEEDHVGNGLVELQRVDLEPDPGQDGVGHGLDPGMVGPRRDEEGEGQGQEEPA